MERRVVRAGAAAKGVATKTALAASVSLAALLCLPTVGALAADLDMDSGPMMEGMVKKPMPAPPPIGVLGTRVMKQGKVTAAIRYKRIEKEGLLQGSDSISPEAVALTVPNAFLLPPTIRVVPLKSSVDVAAASIAYGLTDDLTISAMVPYFNKKVDMLTFAGIAGSTRLGVNTLNSDGFGDARIGSAYRLFDTPVHHFVLNMGVSLPTGSITKEDMVLQPDGTTPVRRLGYGLQLGSGTVDALPGLSYWGSTGAWQWGLMYRGNLRLESSNRNGWRRGHMHMVSGWVGYSPTPWLDTSARLTGTTEGAVKGHDPLIDGAGVGRQPGNYGGETADLFLGLNVHGEKGVWKGRRLGVEVGIPVYQNVNGVQLEKDYSVSAGLTWTF
ncbi:MAG: hypothetical protein C0606_08635 [Hyphomicrobiales bacterium]|nr:MAG: hypothetical protein C0606_08635 [Hyphomicrobiales bacterium]